MAAQVMFGDSSEPPECYLFTDYSIYNSVRPDALPLSDEDGDGFEDDVEWALNHTINGMEFNAYCGGNGYDCESTELNNITINERDGYHCYVKD